MAASLTQTNNNRHECETFAQPAKNCHGGINNKNLATFSTEGGLIFSIFFRKMEN
jgi:hypothetical protein